MPPKKTARKKNKPAKSSRKETPKKTQSKDKELSFYRRVNIDPADYSTIKEKKIRYPVPNGKGSVEQMKLATTEIEKKFGKYKKKIDLELDTSSLRHGDEFKSLLSEISKGNTGDGLNVVFPDDESMTLMKKNPAYQKIDGLQFVNLGDNLSFNDQMSSILNSSHI